MKRWLVVQQCGYADEKIVFESDSLEDAETAYYELYTEDERSELHVAIMERLPNGCLTTEY